MKCLSWVAKDILPFYAGLHVLSKADVISFKIIYICMKRLLFWMPQNIYFISLLPIWQLVQFLQIPNLAYMQRVGTYHRELYIGILKIKHFYGVHAHLRTSCMPSTVLQVINTKIIWLLFSVLKELGEANLLHTNSLCRQRAAAWRPPSGSFLV